MAGAAAPQRFDTPFGEFELRRYPARRREPLQAWSAADLLLLEALATGPCEGTLVVNDEHGALALPAGAAGSWTDSALSALALAGNLRRNERPAIPVTFSTDAPPAAIRRVLLRVPKQLAYFEYQLAALGAALPPGVDLIAGGMDKHLSPHTAAVMERFVGPTRRYRGEHRARLFRATLDGPREAIPPPVRYHCPPLGALLESLPNVFSHDRLDYGSDLLVQQYPGLCARFAAAGGVRVIDLACGAGVLGLAALRAGLAREVVFCDESAMAVASAQGNARRLQPAAACEFHHGDGLRGYSGPAADLVLCNPPFHLQHTVDDFAGRRLLGQAAAHLSPEGGLCVVANSHLGYRPALARAFREVERLAHNRKFTVWLARYPKPGRR